MEILMDKRTAGMWSIISNTIFRAFQDRCSYRKLADRIMTDKNISSPTSMGNKQRYSLLNNIAPCRLRCSIQRLELSTQRLRN
jgi:hypothetical protein